MLRCLTVFISCSLLCLSPCWGQDTLPRVLVIGDSVYDGPAREAARELKGKAEVVYKQLAPGTPLTSTTLLQELAELLGDERWELIHFNVGLGDLTYRTPGIDDFRVMSKTAGGVRTTSADKYQVNLKELINRLKKIEAKLVWASTTPIRGSSSRIFDPGSEVELNRLAEDVMLANGIVINDMHTKVSGLINLERPSAFDPFDFERKAIHPFIVEVIAKELKLGP